MADKGGLLTRGSAAIAKFFLKRELVGVDALGNKYYKYEYPPICLLLLRPKVQTSALGLPVVSNVRNRGSCLITVTQHWSAFVHLLLSLLAFRKFEENVLAEPIERRWVKTPDGLYDPDAVPPEWYQWLRKRRNEAPSLQEVQQYVKCLFGCISVSMLKRKQ